MKPVDQLTEAEFSDLMRRAVRALPDAPADWQQAAFALMPAATLGGAARAAWRLVQAVLTFDSWAGPALAHGMRSPRSATRHLLYSAQGRDLDLRIAQAGDAYTLTGQVLGPDDAGTIELRSEASVPPVPRQTTLDSLGEFRIEGLARGTYTVTLQLGADQIVLPPIDVGTPTA